jgi:REP element-mobilizing transposase RayT
MAPSHRCLAAIAQNAVGATQRRMPEPPPGAPHRGWHLPRRLPHLDAGELVQTITYRLIDALPRATVERNARFATPAQRRRLEALLDAGHGACVLREPEIAALVVEAWRHFHGRRYRLHAWVVMPNHVHLVVTILPGFPLARIVRDWKSFTAHAIAKRSGSGAVWQPGYWDRFIRDDDHFDDAVAYVEANPVKAGLVAHPEAWAWSSAAVRRAGGTPALPATRSMAEMARRARGELERRWPRQ